MPPLFGLVIRTPEQKKRRKEELGRTQSPLNKTLPRTNEDDLSFGFVLIGGEAHDGTVHDELMTADETRPQVMLTDKGYDSDYLRTT
jgi:hypothetical protein